MKSERYDAQEARRVLIGMITDDAVVGRIARNWPAAGLFASRWENMIATWCVEHSRKYSVAPRADIATIFQGANITNTAEHESIDKLISGLDAMHESGTSSEYLLDLAGTLFKRLDLKQRAAAINAALELGEIAEAEAVLTDYRGIELGAGAVDRPLIDHEFWFDVFAERESETLIHVPDGLSKFWGDDLSRDNFVAFLAAEKKGKSWWLLDMAARGLRSRRKVAFFSVGDMSRHQVGKRLARRLCRMPRVAGEYRIPLSWNVGDAAPESEYQYIEGITASHAMRMAARIGYDSKRMSNAQHDLLHIACYPAASINAQGIESVLLDWAKDGWVADIVIIDYADILAPPAGNLDARDQINVNWMHLRRLSSELHCLLITATQANAKSYTADILGRQHFSEDKRKYSHVTAMVGINQSQADRLLGVYHLNMIMRREGEGNETPCSVAGNLDIGCPAMIVQK